MSDKHGGIGVSDIDSLLVGLKLARDYSANVNALNLSVSYVEHIGQIQSSEFAQQAKWNFELLDTYYSFLGNATQRNSSGSCVYFLEHPLYPTLIKIGHTNDLNRRSQELAVANCGLPVKVIAFAQLQQRQDFEAALHLMFSRVRVVGEWFRREPVIAFLNYCRSTN